VCGNTVFSLGRKVWGDGMNYFTGTLIITDLEATCWENMTRQDYLDRETIQIGSAAVQVVRGKVGKVLDRWDQFIKPQVRPILSDYCTKLTGISQVQVDRAFCFLIPFENWLAWAKQFRGAVFCSWGWFDYNQLLQDAYRFDGRGLATLFDFPHLNAKVYCGETMGWRNGRGRYGVGIGTALDKLGLEFEGTPHNGMDDAENVVRILRAVAEQNKA